MDVTDLLVFTVKNKASDLHLSSGMPPLIRVDGDIRKVNLPPLSAKEVEQFTHDIMNDNQRKIYEEKLEVDFSFSIADLARFRINAYHQLRGPAIAFRTIPSDILSIADLNLPDALKYITEYPSGLVVVTGPTGTGKSTTLAAMIEQINRTRNEHIITIEDPIEFEHEPKTSLVHQREVYQHTLGFSEALRSALREDPDIIMVGEMRDAKTTRLALTAAETGHLVFATLHTQSAATTINRIIDIFPTGEKDMVRSMLSSSLQAVISQRLLKKVHGGRIAALEIMICTNAIRHLIREDKIAQMYSAIQTGQSLGMQTLDQHLCALADQKLITFAQARRYAIDKSLFPDA